MTKDKAGLRESLPYRQGVGAVLFNPSGLVFMAQRIDTNGEAWQFPQGGIDEGETPEVAVMRELEEEIGTGKATIIAAAPNWFTYDLPDDLVGKVWKGRYRGQRQKWFALTFLGTDADINLATEHPEFSAWRWLPLSSATEVIVPFKRDLYAGIVAAFAPLAQRRG